MHIMIMVNGKEVSVEMIRTRQGKIGVKGGETKTMKKETKQLISQFNQLENKNGKPQTI